MQETRLYLPPIYMLDKRNLSMENKELGILDLEAQICQDEILSTLVNSDFKKYTVI